VYTWDKHYVAGEWVAGTGGTISVADATTGEQLGGVPEADAAMVDRAVTGAVAAFPAWEATSVTDRADALRAVADGLEERTTDLAVLMAREVGTPLPISERVQVGLAVAIFRSMADLVSKQPDREQIGSSLVLRRPAGVVAAITPWNYPLYQLAAKVAPAMAAGCTVVVKPSSAAPLATFVLAEIVDGLDLPPGVLNLVSGSGRSVGEALVSHPGVDMVSFTGSTGAGSRVAELAGKGIRKVALELGGKSAFVILDGADLEPAVAAAVRSAFVNNGQTCAATSRLLVPAPLLPEVEERVAAAVDAFSVGDPLTEGTDVGPLVSAAQQHSVQEYARLGAAEGTVITHHSDVPGAGYFVAPTVISRLDPSARVAREEIFGPVLSIVGYDDPDAALRIADDSDYGLSGAVWGPEVETAARFASRMRTGQVAVNGGRFNVDAPFGGYRKSGIGRELGPHGLAEYYELTSLQFTAPDVAAAVGSL